MSNRAKNFTKKALFTLDKPENVHRQELDNDIESLFLIVRKSSNYGVVLTATSYTMLTTDFILGVTSTASARTITLPPVANIQAGQLFIVKDESGAAGTNNITLDGNASETIDGATTKVINSNYGVCRLYSNGTAWFTV